MARFFKTLWSIVTYRKRVRLESERQQREGYSAGFTPGGPAESLEYREGDKFLAAVPVELEDGWRKLKIYAYTLKTWDGPVQRRLTPEEFELVLRRIRGYLIRVHEVEEVILVDGPGEPVHGLFQRMG
jgi:hypothetical protein